MTISQRDKALLFHELHRKGEPLVLANAWDVASARIIEDAGSPAVATTSAGVAWSLGIADGDRLGRDAAVDVVARVAAAVNVPVTADIETGFGESPEELAETIRQVLDAGAIGVNLEDGVFSGSTPLRAVDEQVERLRAARQAADAADVPLYVNARVDTYIRQAGDPATRLQETLDRAAAYLAAGASGIFVPAVVDKDTVSALVKGIDAPLNILAWRPEHPTVPELAELGVARVSVGSGVASAAYAVAQRSIRELLSKGSSAELAGALDYGYINGLLAPKA
ncbi:isocitrate lyase/PEP mutase family protein [Streptoalloteichus hindustanus]|nr:isocitrate lyase/phosphoenolpyruvate mutase family protein [Streptoalloteichus hindustanus]